MSKPKLTVTALQDMPLHTEVQFRTKSSEITILKVPNGLLYFVNTFSKGTIGTFVPFTLPVSVEVEKFSDTLDVRTSTDIAISPIRI